MKYWILIFALLFTSTSFAKVTISGVILDNNENPISRVKISENEKNYTYSREDGTFTFLASSYSSIVSFTHEDYLPLKRSLDSVDMKVFLILKVDGNSYNLDHHAGYSDFSSKNVNKRLEYMPYFFGEADVNRQLQMLPGVEHGNEGYSNVLIRGGNVDENLMLYNGTPVYNYNHIYGLTSLFQNRSIHDVRLRKGISPSKYGGRLSSVIELETKKENDYSGAEGELELSLMTGSLHFRNFKKNESFFTLSARRSYVDLFFPVEFRENDFNLYLYDIQANMGKQLKNGQLEINFMTSKDNYFDASRYRPDSVQTFRRDIRFSWGNVLGAVKYKHNITDRLHAEHSVHYSSFQTNLDLTTKTITSLPGPVPTTTLAIDRGIMEYIAQSNWDYVRSNDEFIHFGSQLFVKTYRPGFASYGSINFDGEPDSEESYGVQAFQPSFEWVNYGEYNRNFDDIKLTAGLRTTLYNYKDHLGFYPEPRFNINYFSEPGYALKFAYNRNYQFTKLVHAGGTEGIHNFWVPATANIKPQSSDMINVEAEKKLGATYAAVVSGYMKWLNNIHIAQDYAEATEPGGDWEESLTVGEGVVYGIEAMIMKNEGYVTGWLSYTFSKADRYFEEISTDRFIFDFDRPHMLKLYANYEANDFWDFSVNFLYGSGKPFSIPGGRFRDIYGNIQLDYSSINNYRSQNYQRLDLMVSKVRATRGMNHRLKFHVYNLLGNKNPLSLDPTFENGFTTFKVNRTFVTVVPGFTYSITF